MKKIYLFASVIFWAIFSFGQIPPGYYDGTENLTGQALLDKLNQIITSGHQTNSYGDLYNYYESTDRYPGTDKVWDMYSMDGNGNAQYYYYFGQDQECGTYQGEGDCYNREHSVPASWFDDNYPMYADLFIVYPTDGYVNNRRSNYPYGQVDNPSWTSTNGSKVGTNSFPGGPSTTVFEPIDAYKGDFARTYFYVATRYKSDIPNWDFSTNLAYVFNSDGTLKDWAVQMFLQWCELDPVSDKEIARNDSVYKIQGNRNPFIDHPEFIGYIWGNDTPDDSTIVTSTDTLFYESFTDCSLDGWLNMAPEGSNGWSCSSYGYMYANAYNATAASDDWLITPQIDPTGKTNITLSFKTYTKYTDDNITYPPLKVLYSSDYDGSSDPRLFTWNSLSWNVPSEDSQVWTSSGDVDLSSVGSPFYIAFNYVSSGTTAGQCALWELDNILITAQNPMTQSNAVTENLSPEIRIWPNPALNGKAHMSITLPSSTTVHIQIFSSDGKPIKTINKGTLTAGKHIIDLSVPVQNYGILFIKISTTQTSETLKLIVK